MEDWFEEKVAVEFQLEREQARVKTLQAELQQNQYNFEIERVTIKEMIDRKKAELDSLTVDYGQPQQNPSTFGRGDYSEYQEADHGYD